MAIRIDAQKAEKKLLEAFKSPCKKSDEILDLIFHVITGTHKTYKYVLINGLLAKATDENIDPLSLQAGAPINGAYDARSLCHNVLVPFERNFLQNALGGSNEPFLNKPARATHLSDKNPVRDGRDRETLNSLIRIFTSIKRSSDAEQYLACSLKLLIERIGVLAKTHDTTSSFNPTLIDIYDFIVRFIDDSFEGETCAVVVGALEKIFHAGLKGSFLVVPHKVNQSGASSKEVGDIDIFEKGAYRYSIEVKDKAFTPYDVEHALNKIIQCKGIKGAFIYGPRASFDQEAMKVKLLGYEKMKFIVLFMDVRAYAKVMLFKSNINDKSVFIKTLMETAIQINSKEAVRFLIKDLMKELNWVR